jgi:hypothetical protein
VKQYSHLLRLIETPSTISKSVSFFKNLAKNVSADFSNKVDAFGEKLENGNNKVNTTKNISKYLNKGDMSVNYKQEKYIEDKNDNINKLLKIDKFKKITQERSTSNGRHQEFRKELFNIMNSNVHT